ncbi:transcriptional regulator [Levilactobacillus paucivorans]|uniref:Transcriptional regulator n=1 Tax=Levilactobacillus paucivorans TaxID=616990 RepID=A0A0R2LSJ3_9LACO|nr:TetR/AcrR family transcriptional regulator [Levilactobacillus paucivorans]KRO04199.1 transcriptional regulator [Levilactobacillus paucivorans]
MARVTNDTIIKTAEALLKNNETVTLAKLAEKLDITHPALYKHFKNKDELWTAVLTKWFTTEVFNQIDVTQQTENSKLALRDWLWQFVTLKKNIYNQDPRMFALNTKYIDERPLVLRELLQGSYAQINDIMGYDDPTHLKAEAIMSAFAIFTVPSFKETWNDPDYGDRFDAIWRLIEKGL